MSHRVRIALTDILSGSNPDAVYVIAEVGSNHAGDLQQALRYIDACADAGADAIKFQSWTASEILNRIDPVSNEPHPAFSVLEQYQLPLSWYPQLKQHCIHSNIDFLSTPFDIDSARVLRDTGVPAIKIASGDLTYNQLLKEVGSYQLPILLSTGMANLVEIELALQELGKAARQSTILLHCVGAYPPDIRDANLRAITTLADTFKLPVGLSDHYPDDTTALAAIALGARVIEKHVTFSRTSGTPDSPFALEVDEFKTMVDHIRQLQQALGDGLKQCRPSEAGGIVGGRRSLYWKVDLEEGEHINEQHLAVLRPNSGDFQPIDVNRLIGRKLVRAVSAHRPVSHLDVDLD